MRILLRVPQSRLHYSLLSPLPHSTTPSSFLSLLGSPCLISPSQPIVSHICKPPRQAKLAHVVPGACCLCLHYLRASRRQRKRGKRGGIFWRMLSCLSKVAAARVVAANELLPLRRKPCSSNNVSNYKTTTKGGAATLSQVHKSSAAQF